METVTYTAAQLDELRALLVMGFFLSLMVLILENWEREK